MSVALSRPRSFFAAGFAAFFFVSSDDLAGAAFFVAVRFVAVFLAAVRFAAVFALVGFAAVRRPRAGRPFDEAAALERVVLVGRVMVSLRSSAGCGDSVCGAWAVANRAD